MQGYLPEYELNPATWAYLSSLLIIGIFFKFHRLWSIRNFDLIGLILLAPGVILVGRNLPAGFVWLFFLNFFFLVRFLIDPLLVRRPLLEPNLNASGLTFTGIALLVFLMGNVIGGKTSELAAIAPTTNLEIAPEHCPLVYKVPQAYTEARTSEQTPEASKRQTVEAIAVRILSLLCHLAIVLGIVLVGYHHFDNVQTGVAMASLYLLLPYTSQILARVDHVLPAALLVWAILSYRQPFAAGLFVGAAAAVIGYPLALLPLWCSFYWRRGLLRFIVGTVVGLAVAVLLLWLAVILLVAIGADLPSAATLIKQLFAWARFDLADANGFWLTRVTVFRIPVIALFIALSLGLAIWPPQKNLGTLISCSGAVMLATQFWHPFLGGTYLAWYLPLLVMTIFRPNLEDRTAINAVTPGWLPWRARVLLAAWWQDWA